MVKIALIDDHPLTINGIGAWLCASGRFAISGTAGNPAEAVSLMERLDPLPEIIILDVSLGDEDGLALIPKLKEIYAQRKNLPPGILICSMHEDPFLIQRAMDLGAAAYVAKSAEAEEITAAIDAILAGAAYVNPKYKMKEKIKTWSALTRRESEIVTFIKRSLSTRQIARQLGLSKRTIENHLAHIYVKTGAASREDLINL